MPRFINFLSLGVVLLAVPAPSRAETELAPQEMEEVIVESPGLQALLEYVEVLADPGPTGQLARWNRTICPQVLSINPEYVEAITWRILEVAGRVNVTLMSDKCDPTVSVLLTLNPQITAEKVAEKFELAFRHDGDLQLKRFLEPDQPVRWITVTDPCGFGCLLRNSRIRKSTAPSLHSMVIVVDVNRLADYSVAEIADYVALVALANPTAQSRQSSESIMSMFERERVEGRQYRLTDHDRAFLHALYLSEPEFDASRQQASITLRMARELEVE